MAASISLQTLYPSIAHRITTESQFDCKVFAPAIASRGPPCQSLVLSAIVTTDIVMRMYSIEMPLTLIFDEPSLLYFPSSGEIRLASRRYIARILLELLS